MGSGGSDLRDAGHIPASLKAMELKLEDVTQTFRYVDRMVPDLDDRVEFLHIILGE
jgi:hypothetical protein